MVATLLPAVPDTAAPLTSTPPRTCAHLQTERQCEAELRRPVVGGLGAYCHGHLAHFGGPHRCDRLLQCLAIALQRENAQAVLRRLAPGIEAALTFAEP